MKFNTSKSQAIRIGRSRRTDTCHITLNGSDICFVDELKYLGWYVVSAKCFKMSMHQILLMLTASHTCCMDLKSLHGIVVNCLI